jgi:hypothetical protein
MPETDPMRLSNVPAKHALCAMALSALALTACSEQTEQNAEEALTSAAADTAANVEGLLEDGAAAAGNAAADLDREVAEDQANAGITTGDSATPSSKVTPLNPPVMPPPAQ